MSVFHAFERDPHIAALFRQRRTPAERLALVASLRGRAIAGLADAITRVPVVSDRIAELFRAAGKEPVWDLFDNDQAVRFVLALRGRDTSPGEENFAALLRACVAAQEAGDVSVFADQQLGEERRASQRAKAKVQRKGRHTPGAKARAVEAYQMRKSEGQARDQVQLIADRFKVTPQTILRWVKAAGIK